MLSRRYLYLRIFRGIAGAIIVAGFAGYGAVSAIAQSTYLDRFALPGDPAALRGFSEIRLKPVGRVDVRVEMAADIVMSGKRGHAEVVTEGYAMLESDGNFIRRTDKILKVKFDLDVAKEGKGSVIATFDGATIMESILNDRSQLQSINMHNSEISSAKVLRATGAIRQGDAEKSVEAFVGMAWNAAANSIVRLPEKPVRLGDQLIDTSAAETKKEILDLTMSQALQGLTEQQRRQIVASIEVERVDHNMTLRGITRFKGVDLLDYRGDIAMSYTVKGRPIGGEGEARALIDPYTGIVRAYVFDGRSKVTLGDGTRSEMKIRYALETMIEGRIAAPMPQPPAPAVPYAGPPEAGVANVPSLPQNNGGGKVMSSADVYDQAAPSVVVVEVADGHGSGFFIADGVVVTNAHVVGDQNTVGIKIGGRVTNGRVLKVNKVADIAFVVTEASQRPLSLASDVPRTGETALVIGAPIDEELAGSLTGGLVSSVRIKHGYKYVQMDAAISSGNSGGPVLDASGKVIGMATFSISIEGGVIHSEGLNFAISATEIRKFYGM